jgi:hypothetical protein
MATEATKQPLDAKIEALIEKIAKETRTAKGNGKKRRPFERITLQGEGPTTTEIIAEGRR